MPEPLSLPQRINRWLLDHHRDDGYTAANVIAAIPAPAGTDEAEHAHKIRNALGREVRRGNLTRTRTGEAQMGPGVRYAASPALRAADAERAASSDRRSVAEARLQGAGVTLTSTRPLPVETVEAVAAIVTATA